MCSFNCGVGESLQIGNYVRLEICEAERGQVLIALHWPPGRKKTMVEIISPRDQDGYRESGIVGESTMGKAILQRPVALVMEPKSGNSHPGYHESSAGREHRIDRGETAKIFACKAGSYQDKNP
ncbi:MAG: hypothetical protein LC667_19235 [Thioalkalivibrio sp.]|nr:hypothetical protein [Thioalkalivibrio sp.]